MCADAVPGRLVLASATVLPLSGAAVVVTVALAMVLHGMYGVPNLLVLNPERRPIERRR